MRSVASVKLPKLDEAAADNLNARPFMRGTTEHIMQRIIKSPYFIASVIVFLLIFFVMLLGVKATFGESLLLAAVLAVVGIGAAWFKEYIW